MVKKNFKPFTLRSNYCLVGFSDQYYKFFGPTSGSFAVGPARILGFETYADYLRFVSKEFGAKLDLGSVKYPVAYFMSEEECQPLCDLLNKRWSEIVKKFDL